MAGMDDGYIMAIATCADKGAARAIARMLVESRLAACAQMFPIESVYRWRGEVHDEGETALLIKSKRSLFGRIAAAIKQAHPYEVPEIIHVPIGGGLPEYLGWIDECVGEELKGEELKVEEGDVR